MYIHIYRCACVNICITCVRTYVNTWAYIHTDNTHVDIHMYTQIYGDFLVYMHICTTCTHKLTYIYTYLCAHVPYMYIHLCTYIVCATAIYT